MKDLEQFCQVGFEFEFIRKNIEVKQIADEISKLCGVKMAIEDKHHSEFKPSILHWKVEPDLSAGVDTVELITGPLPYLDARKQLVTILKYIKTHKELYTTEKCGIHINVNWKDKPYIANIDILKFIAKFDENEVYSRFPNRVNNIYAKSIKHLVPIYPYFNFDNYVYNKNNFKYPDSKYFGVNFLKLQKGYLEFRYLGGENYENKTVELLYLTEYFLISLKNAYENEIDSKEITRILKPKKLVFIAKQNYENFKKLLPNIKILIDTGGNDQIIKSFFDKIVDRIFNLLITVRDVKELKGTINYDSDNSVIELKDFTFKDLDIELFGFLFYDCKFTNCVIKNSNIYYSALTKSHVIKCKTDFNTYMTSRITEGVHNSNEIKNCYLEGGNLLSIYNSEIKENTIFRSGNYKDCEIDKTCEIIEAIDLDKPKKK